MATLTPTLSHSQRYAWAIQDTVIRLRQWATDVFYELDLDSKKAGSEWTIGSMRTCAIHLNDRFASRRHAELSYREGTWNVADLNSRNGIVVDGVRVTQAGLEPGTELRIGRTTLLAESLKSVELRTYLCRLIGWSAKRAGDVDNALRLLRKCQRERQPIVLRGEGNLVPVAEELHRRIFDRAAPFVKCDPSGASSEASERKPTNVKDVKRAFAEAAGGSLCVRHERQPEGLQELRKPSTKGVRGAVAVG